MKANPAAAFLGLLGVLLSAAPAGAEVKKGGGKSLLNDDPEVVYVEEFTTGPSNFSS